MLSKTLLSLALAAPAYSAVHEAIAALPAGWEESTTVQLNDDSPLQMHVALSYQNLDSLESKLKSVSEPSSSSYGKYLSLEELNSIFAASSTSESKVKSWLQKSGATDITSDGTTVSFKTTAGEANKMLDTEFKVYTNGEKQKVGTMQYSVPDELGDAVDVIEPTTFFSSMVAHAAIPSLPVEKREESLEKRINRACLKHIEFNVGNSTNPDDLPFNLLSPQCLKELYNVGNYQADPNSGSSVAFGNFLNESASYSDLAKFEKIFNIPSQSFKILALINGGVNNQNPLTEADGEANLDVQNLIGLVDGLPVGAYITGGSPPFIGDLLSNISSPPNQNEPYLPYYSYLLSQPDSALPWVITNSYGDHEDTVPERYAKRVCNMIGMMGLRGRTVLESSGDEGTGAVCRSNRGSAPVQFTPQFPGTCPYVTAVGGTQFLSPEWAWNASSGGFSNYFPTAWYQEEAVQTYLDKYINPVAKEYYSSNQYVNFSGRGFPDVAAHSLYP